MKKLLFGILFSFLLFIVLVGVVRASHSWGNYHWARQSNPFTLKLGDNLSSNWDSYLTTTSSDWSQSSVLDTVVVSGGTTARRCRPTRGLVEVCNYRYGRNGWLGLAQIWVSGDHITQGVTKVNDTYFNTTSYNTAAWKNLVMCQEVGHTLGLDHQDENFDNGNLGTCMDYTSNPDSNQYPNAHDYEILEQIYAHVDSLTTLNQSTGQTARQIIGQVMAELGEDRGSWGKSLKDNGRVALFERDFGGGNKVFTFVVWAR